MMQRGKEWQTAVGMKDGESFWYTVPTFSRGRIEV